MPATNDLGKTVLVGVVAGVFAALVCVAIFKLLDVEVGAAVVGGIAGAVAGVAVPSVMRRERRV